MATIEFEDGSMYEGETKKMEEFIQSNSGFKSRITDYINFDDFNAEANNE